MTHFVLGLDLGPNSIGWALVDDDPKNKEESSLIDIGVRVFPAGVGVGWVRPRIADPIRPHRWSVARVPYLFLGGGV